MCSRPRIGRQPDPALADARRQQILDAAAACFLQQGYHAASMANISRTAAMSTGHIYHFFASKEEIIAAIIARDLQAMYSAMDEITLHPGPRLQALVDNIRQGVQENLAPDHSALQLEMLAEAARNPKVAELLRDADTAARQRLHDLLVSPRASLTPEQASDLHGALDTLCTLFNGLLIRAVLHPQLDREALVRSIQRAVLGILAPLEGLFQPA